MCVRESKPKTSGFVCDIPKNDEFRFSFRFHASPARTLAPMTGTQSMTMTAKRNFFSANLHNQMHLWEVFLDLRRKGERKDVKGSSIDKRDHQPMRSFLRENFFCSIWFCIRMPDAVLHKCKCGCSGRRRRSSSGGPGILSQRTFGRREATSNFPVPCVKNCAIVVPKDDARCETP